MFTVETDQGVTGLVLLGRGDMRFSPAPETEKGQVRIFAGADTLESRFDAAFIRVGTLGRARRSRRAHAARRSIRATLRRAEQIFREESAKSFVVDLADLTRDTWSLLPGADDFLAEIRTRRFDTLTYARSASEPEDISFFERRRQRNIARLRLEGQARDARAVLQRGRPRRRSTCSTTTSTSPSCPSASGSTAARRCDCACARRRSGS